MSEKDKISIMNLLKHVGGKAVCFDNGVTILLDGNILRFGPNEWEFVKSLLIKVVGRIN